MNLAANPVRLYDGPINRMQFRWENCLNTFVLKHLVAAMKDQDDYAVTPYRERTVLEMEGIPHV